MGTIGSARKDFSWIRLHHEDGAHRGTARSANGAEVTWFEEHIKDHLDQHAMEEAAWKASFEMLRRLPEGHRIYTRVVKRGISGAAHIIARFPYQVVSEAFAIQWVNIDPRLIGCERSSEDGAYALDETGVEANQELVRRIGDAVHQDPNYFTRWAL